MKRSIYLIIAAVLVLGMTAGCTSDNSSPPVADTAPDANNASTASAANTTAPAAAGEEITLTLLSTTLSELPDGDVERKMIETYMEQNPHITIETSTVSSNDMLPKITAMVTANDAPDIFTGFTGNIVPLIDMNAIEPLDDLLGKAYVDDVAEAVKGEVFYNDTLYIAPWGAIPTGFVYRKDIFDEAGLQPPRTFDEVADILKPLTGDGKYGLALIASNNSSAAGRFIPMLRNCGAAEIKEDGGKYITEINSPGGIAILNFFYQWANVDKITPVGVGETDHAAAINLLATEQAYATFTGPHTIGSVVEQTPSLRGKFAVAPMPTLNPSDKSVATGNINGFSIYSKSTHKVEAAAYLAFLTSPANFEVYNAATNRLPPLKSQVTDAVKNNPVSAGFITALDNAYPLLLTPYNGDITNILASALNAMATGAETDAAAVAADAEEKINQVLNR